ncbi:PucR family transcriptional regulator [Brevibacillus sp. SYSU BS000544]|uniref:PucR family transcriptional regulator n=1 Tax=Brevibacillus sp. SYSU BS000544 TaxID=3416443 RepID=UPI003CE4C07D
MLREWEKQVEMIKQVTKLNLGLFSCIQTEWENFRLVYEQTGNEVIQYFLEGDTVWYIGIVTNEWSKSARAMLPLLFPMHLRENTNQEQALHWLKAVWNGEKADPPASLHAAMNWTEPRICFCITRLGILDSNIYPFWRELFGSFFSTHGNFLLLSLSPKVHLLLLPSSLLLSVTKKEDNPQEIEKEWAYSIHDLLATEASEKTRVFVTHPLHQPTELAGSLHAFQTLTNVFTLFFPNQYVAATSDYRLEQWAISLNEQEKLQIQSALSAHSIHALGPEHIELLREFFQMNLNSSETARKLYLHRNTLLYRLDKITEVTGLDPRHFHDAVILRLLLIVSAI